MVLLCHTCGSGTLRERETFPVKGQKYFVYECSFCGVQFFYAFRFKKEPMRGELLMEEKMIAVSTNVSKAKAFSEMMKKWREESRKKNEPVCESCAHFDFQKGNLKDQGAYSKGIKFIRENPIKNSNRNSDSYGKTIGMIRDYECPNGHGISMELELVEIKK